MSSILGTWQKRVWQVAPKRKEKSWLLGPARVWPLQPKLPPGRWAVPDVFPLSGAKGVTPAMPGAAPSLHVDPRSRC